MQKKNIKRFILMIMDHLDNYGHITFFFNYKSLHIVILLHVTWSYYNYCNIIYYNNKSENKKLTAFLIKRTSIF